MRSARVPWGTRSTSISPEIIFCWVTGLVPICEVDLVPQGTLAERMRAAGYGLGGVLTPTGLGTEAAKGKQTLELDGASYLVERPLAADYAMVRAHRADYNGNLDFTLTARNFNPIMCMAAETVIVEPDMFVPLGVIPPDGVVVPGILVDTLISRGA